MESATPPRDPEQERRQRLFKLVGAAIVTATLAIVVLIVVSESGDKSGDTDIETAATGLEGLEQAGDTVGDPAAPVTIVEYGDLQCPVCRQFARQEIPAVLDGPVRAGDAKLRFANWVILGPDSDLAARAALAAGEQDKMWDFVEIFYENQGAENSGYVDDAFLEAIAEEAGLDLETWDEDRADPALEAEIGSIDREAVGHGLTGTPSIVVIGADGQAVPLPGVPTAADIQATVEQAS